MRLNFKRLYLLSAKASRACAALAELTPARLDLMTTVLRHERSQTELAQILCVAHSVVSRIVRALVELGFVRQRIPEEDRRFRMISLTPRGHEQLESVLDAPVPSHGQRGAQCMGEEAWLAYWRKPLARLGLDFAPLLAAETTAFWLLRTLNRASSYLPWLVESETPFVALE